MKKIIFMLIFLMTVTGCISKNDNQSITVCTSNAIEQFGSLYVYERTFLAQGDEIEKITVKRITTYKLQSDFDLFYEQLKSVDDMFNGIDGIVSETEIEGDMQLISKQTYDLRVASLEDVIGRYKLPVETKNNQKYISLHKTLDSFKDSNTKESYKCYTE